MKKKLKNVNLFDLICSIVCLMPILIIFGYYLFVCISNSGVTTQSMDFQTIFLAPLKDFQDINILGLSNFNSWLLDNVIKIGNDVNDFVKYSITFGLFMIEYYIFIYIVKVFVKCICCVLSLVDDAF